MSKLPQLPKYQYVCKYCYFCQRNIYKECRENGDRKPLNKCKHTDRQVYKAYLPKKGEKGKRITRVLKAKTPDEAIIEVIKLKGASVEQKISAPTIGEKIVQRNSNYNLKQLMSRYVGFVSGDLEFAPAKSKSMKWDTCRTFKQMTTFLARKQDMNTISVNELTVMHAGGFKDYLLKELQLQARSFNKAKTIFSGFYKYLSGYEGIELKNPFSIIPQEPTSSNIEIPTKEELQLILEAMENPEFGICRAMYRRKGKIKFQNKQLFRTWLRPGTEFLVQSGRRAEEAIRVKWNNYHESAEGSYLQIEDFKVNRIKRLTGDRTKYIYVPVTESLRELLNRLGLEKFKGQDRYILAPDDPMDRNTLNRFFTRAFTQFRKSAGVERDISLKSCRKFYITELVKHAGISTAQLITGHSSPQIMKDAYINQKAIALSQSVKNFQPFVNGVNGNERKNDLEKIRKQKSNNKEIELTK